MRVTSSIRSGVARRKPPRPGTPALLTSSETRGCRSTIAAAVALDRLAVADVAELPLGAELLGERPQALLAARDQDAVPAAPAQGSRHRGPDPARAAGDDR